MVNELLNPFGPGIWIALGLVVTFGVLSTAIFWTPDVVLPTWRPKASPLAIACMFLAASAVCMIAAQFLGREMLPLMVQSDIATIAYVITVLECGLGCILVIPLYLSQRKFRLLALRNVAVLSLLLYSMWYTGQIFDRRAYAYWVWAQDGMGSAVIRWSESNMPVWFMCLFVLDFGVAVGLTIHLARKERKIGELRRRNNLLSWWTQWPISRFRDQKKDNVD